MNIRIYEYNLLYIKSKKTKGYMGVKHIKRNERPKKKRSNQKSEDPCETAR